MDGPVNNLADIPAGTGLTTYVASADGQSIKVARAILRRLGLPEDDFIRLTPKAPPPRLQADKPVLLVAPVRYGVHMPEADAVLAAWAAAPEKPRFAFASVNLSARKPEKRSAATNNYVRKALEKHKITPDITHAIAGKLNYPAYSPRDRLLIRLIMWMAKGPTKGTEVIEYTDWDDVDAFADELPRVLGLPLPTEVAAG